MISVVPTIKEEEEKEHRTRYKESLVEALIAPCQIEYIYFLFHWNNPGRGRAELQLLFHCNLCFSPGGGS